MKRILVLLILVISHNLYALDRIVSTVPSLTEILYELGLRKEVVGVSKYCLFNSDFCSRPKVGTSLDFSYEKILKLKASTALLSSSASKGQVSNLKKLNIETILLKHDRLEDIYQSIETLGARFNKIKRASELKEIIEASLKTESLEKKRVLFLISSQLKDGQIVKVQAAASKNFYTDILEKMGLINALVDSEIFFPEIGREKLLSLEYDYIIEIFGSHNSSQISVKRNAWNSFLKTSKGKFKYRSLVGDYLFIPGPSVWKIANDLKLGLRK